MTLSKILQARDANKHVTTQRRWENEARILHTMSVHRAPEHQGILSLDLIPPVYVPWLDVILGQRLRALGAVLVARHGSPPDDTLSRQGIPQSNREVERLPGKRRVRDHVYPTVEHERIVLARRRPVQQARLHVEAALALVCVLQVVAPLEADDGCPVADGHILWREARVPLPDQESAWDVYP